MKDWQILHLYLRNNLNMVKRNLGEACCFLSFSKERVKNEDTGEFETVDAFNVLMKNDLGGKDRVILKIGKSLSALKQEDFSNLFFKLNAREYDRDTETV